MYVWDGRTNKLKNKKTIVQFISKPFGKLYKQILDLGKEGEWRSGS